MQDGDVVWVKGQVSKNEGFDDVVFLLDKDGNPIYRTTTNLDLVNYNTLFSGDLNNDKSE